MSGTLSDSSESPEMIERCKLSVLIASHSSSMTGGAERSLFDLCEALALREDIDVTVTFPTDGTLFSAVQQLGIRCHVIPTPRWTPYARTVFNELSRIRDIIGRTVWTLKVLRRLPPWYRLLGDVHPDVVVTKTATIPLPAIASFLRRTPHIWWIHEFVDKDHGLRFVLGDRLSRRVIGLLSKAVIVNSQAVRRRFSPPVEDSKIRTIYPVVRGFDCALNVSSHGSLRLLMIGRQERAKGTLLAVQALGRAVESGVDARLRLVGTIRDAFRSEVEALAADLDVFDRVLFVEFTLDPSTEYDWANVVLMCSTNEAFGRVTMEALKSGRPVVGVRSGGTPEIVVDGTNGFLVDPNDADAIGLRLVEIARSPALLHKLSEGARQTTRDTASIEQLLDEFILTARGASRTSRSVPRS